MDVDEKEKISKALDELEDANQKIFDEKVVAVLTAFLGVVFTFRDKLNIRTWTWEQKLLCSGMVVWIAVSIAMVVYSHYYGAVIARKYNKQINKMITEESFDVYNAMRNMECLNMINCLNFIISIVLICGNILVYIF